MNRASILIEGYASIINMRVYLLILILFTTGIPSRAQLTLTPVVSEIEGDPTVIVTPTMQITNTGISQVIWWKRVVNDLPEGWTSTVMDPLMHWTSETDEPAFGFVLNPDTALTIWVHFDARNYHDGIFDPVAGCGEVELVFYSKFDSLQYNAVGTFKAYLGATAEECSVSITPNTDGTGLHVYPNPASTFTRINAPFDAHISNYIIYNIFGEVQLSGEWDTLSKSTSIDVHTFQAGTYMIVLMNAEHQIVGRETLVIAGK